MAKAKAKLAIDLYIYRLTFSEQSNPQQLHVRQVIATYIPFALRIADDYATDHRWQIEKIERVRLWDGMQNFWEIN